jgi:tRNA threonylcarbamoyladenosine biosynthesis protein TsaE
MYVISHSEAETRDIAKRIAPLFCPGDLIVLDGDLGAGKTHFVKGFADGFSSCDLVTSPTFSIANFYRTDKCNLLHVDLYRISSVAEFYDLGLVDYFPQAIVLIEWGKKIMDFLDDNMLISFVSENDNKRILTFFSDNERYKLLIASIKTKITENKSC